jgi:predicted choloylglycine hydrolase
MRFSRYRLTVLSAILVAATSAAVAHAGEPFRYPEAKYDKGELKYINGLPVLTVEGTPEEMGSAVGALAVRPAKRMHHYPEELLKHYCLHVFWEPFVTAGKKMVQQFPEDYRQELEAMARGGDIDPDLLAVGNTLFDLKKILACSALLVGPDRSDTGGPLLGRNLDYPPLGYAQEYSLVTVYRPAGGKHAFASVGFPGLVGCLSGINDAGLSLAILEVFQIKAGLKRFDRSGTPYALCYRRLLEECTTIAEARDLLETMKRTTITNLVIADRHGVAVFEVTPTSVQVRRPQQGTCVCTNHFCTDELKPYARINVCRTTERYQALEKVSKVSQEQRKLGLLELHCGLDAACDPDMTMQTMVFEPATLRLHLAIGKCPASAGQLKRLELGPLLRAPSTGSRPSEK